MGVIMAVVPVHINNISKEGYMGERMESNLAAYGQFQSRARLVEAG